MFLHVCQTIEPRLITLPVSVVDYKLLIFVDVLHIALRFARKRQTKQKTNDEENLYVNVTECLSLLLSSLVSPCTKLNKALADLLLCPQLLTTNKNGIL